MLAKRWQELMALVIKLGLLIITVLFSQNSTLSGVYSKSDLNMILGNDKKSDLH